MKKLTIALGVLAMTSQPAFAKTVQSLSEVPKQIKSQEIRNRYDEQMDGITRQDGFGSLSRDDNRINALLSLMGHDTNTRNLGLLSLKEWQNNQYIAVACSYAEPINLNYLEQKNRYAECSNSADTISVAVLKKNAQGQWQLVAKPYHERPQTIPNKNKSNSAFTLDSRDEGDVTGELDRLDLANYHLNASTKAFGIRYSASVGYAGGGATNQAMTLFALIDGQLKPVLSVPTYEYENLAGAWNQDGTRQHDINTTEYVVVVSPQQKNGFNNLIWREKSVKKPEQHTYTWNSQTQHYE